MINLNFDKIPIIETAHYLLRELVPADVDDIFTLRSNESVNRYIERAPAVDLADATAFIERITTAVEDNQVMYWVVTEESTSDFIGTFLLWKPNHETSTIEIGYEITPAWQGRGVLKEIMPEVLRFAIHEMKVKRFVAEVHRENIRSVKILQRHDFRVIKSDSEFWVYEHKK